MPSKRAKSDEKGSRCMISAPRKVLVCRGASKMQYRIKARHLTQLRESEKTSWRRRALTEGNPRKEKGPGLQKGKSYYSETQQHMLIQHMGNTLLAGEARAQGLLGG